MKKITLSFSILLSVLCASNNFAQDTRYIDPIFDDVEETFNIVYGANKSVALGENYPVTTGDSAVIGYDTTTSPPTATYFNMPNLELDIIEPAGDTETERPLIIYLHTGTFAPIIINENPTGSRTYDVATQMFCAEYALRGYVVANTDYRFGWDPALPTEAERGASLMKAAYRGIQDVKAAIRFLRKDYENGNTYGIDTSRIIICGQGTGGWIATCLNSVDKLAELQLPKFLDSNAVPLIDTSVVGDWFGYGGNPAYNIENHVGYSSDHDMILNMGGAIGDLSWLEAGDKPMAAVHGNLDAIARFTTGNLSVQGNNIVTTISGSHDVVKKANSLGNNAMIGNLFDPYTVAAKAASASLVNTTDFSGVTITESVDNLFPFNTGNPGEGAPWDYWDSSTVVLIAQGLGLPASAGSAAHVNGLTTNPNMSIQKAAAYIDSTLGFFCPRIVNTLMLPGNTSGISSNDVEFNTYPNPTTDFISFNSSNNISEVSIFDNSGKLVRRFNPNQFTITVDLSDLPRGIYISEVKTTNKIHSEKIILK
jgi:hypothetical protein